MLQRRAFLGAFAVLPFVSTPLPAMEAPIKLRDLYNKDQTFSDLALSLEGQRITVDGFMAPPLKAEANFFVLTKRPMATCPFCESSADWPDDILAVYTKRTVKVIPFNVKIVTQGVLELGDMTDPETGFVSRVRLVDAKYS
ncbi:hypothetical protein [Meridianimarinicoccus aquatilis]|uniref:DUF3299 domain-containing protein n=1 Tax=Meridianimarinicoccus aquatilis TaxID=2552766 RepID=A0A4R6AP79_9RHOB|nr:hypothetical protein [Fluviibacterium aquatile]TDL83786.1 hypothetical protein E2L05_19320 [Fluviibacterium aquatile]